MADVGAVGNDPGAPVAGETSSNGFDGGQDHGAVGGTGNGMTGVDAGSGITTTSTDTAGTPAGVTDTTDSYEAAQEQSDFEATLDETAAARTASADRAAQIARGERVAAGIGLDSLQDRSPEVINDTFKALSAEDQIALATARPEQVAALDGVPIETRSVAAKALVEQDLETLRAERAKLPAAVHANQWETRQIEQIEGAIAQREAILEAEVALFSPLDDGRVVTVQGDIRTAENIAVMVPGVANSLSSFAGFQDRATAIQETISELTLDGALPVDEQTAVVSWLGYDTPDWLVSGMSSSKVREAGNSLPRFIDGLRADLGSDRHLTVVAHSYGSTLAMRNARDYGLDVDSLLVVGSPGAVESVADVRRSDGSQVEVYAMASSGDVVTWSEAHGLDPARDPFGAVRLATPDTHGHSDYFDRGTLSLRNIAAVIVGDRDLMIFADPKPQRTERQWGWEGR